MTATPATQAMTGCVMPTQRSGRIKTSRFTGNAVTGYIYRGTRVESVGTSGYSAGVRRGPSMHLFGGSRHCSGSQNFVDFEHGCAQRCS